MSGQPMNRRPYGDSWANNAPAVEGGSLEEQAISRAKAKLEAVRHGRAGDQEIGADMAQMVPGTILSLLIGLPLLLGGIAIASNNGFNGGVVFMVGLGLVFMGVPVLLYFQTRPRSAKGALKGFYRALARKRWKRARSLVVQPDLDNFPRFQPMIANLGQPANAPRQFRSDLQFADYWEELLLSGSMPYCLVTVRKVNEVSIGPDVMLVNFELRLMMNTRLYLLLFLVIGIIALIIDMATRKTVTVPMQKILVRVGEEWHLFSGEWQGYEEFNTQWLRDNQSRPATPRAGWE